MSAEPAARQRILDSAYDLFSRRGVRAVGIEEVIERAAVAKATLYRHFPSKDHLVLEFLRQRETIWTHGWVEAEARIVVFGIRSIRQTGGRSVDPCASAQSKRRRRANRWCGP